MHRQGVNNAELAKRMSMSRESASKMMAGQTEMTLRRLARVGLALGVRFKVNTRTMEEGA